MYPLIRGLVVVKAVSAGQRPFWSGRMAQLPENSRITDLVRLGNYGFYSVLDSRLEAQLNHDHPFDRAPEGAVPADPL